MRVTFRPAAANGEEGGHGGRGRRGSVMAADACASRGFSLASDFRVKYPREMRKDWTVTLGLFWTNP